MCGVSGVVAKTEAVEARREVALMNAAVRHRGPDGEGIFSRPGLALGHRRLAILDLSEHGHQPMQRGDRYWITYNGEIYNYRELREELVTMGETFHSGSDTEVILAAYARWGADCVHRFNGMWAFVIYDALEECLFLSRDRFGVKPLYYVDTPSRFAFGSEIKQLLPQLPTIRANREVLLHSLLTGIDDHTHETYFAEVLSFPQGHRGTYDLRTNRLTMERWYALKSATEAAGLSDTEATEQFRTLFEDAVRLRMRADVKVGTCLSGGLDSSATSSVASRIYHESSANRFLAIHAKSTERETDESLHARRAADALGIELHVVEPTIAEFFDTIDELSHTQERRRSAARVRALFRGSTPGPAMVPMAAIGACLHPAFKPFPSSAPSVLPLLSPA
jgi:asparagine synthase (glutamine-hydrolysing)